MKKLIKNVYFRNMKAHDNIINEVAISNENIVFHFLVVHPNDQQQQLDLILFRLMKRY